MRATLLFILLFVLSNAHAQLDPVQWSYQAEKVSEDEYDIIFTARIDKGWSVYSPHLEGGGPIPTAFEFYDDITTIGKTRESRQSKRSI